MPEGGLLPPDDMIEQQRPLRAESGRGAAASEGRKRPLRAERLRGREREGHGWKDTGVEGRGRAKGSGQGGVASRGHGEWGTGWSVE